jgi:hypothetical protein
VICNAADGRWFVAFASRPSRTITFCGAFVLGDAKPGNGRSHVDHPPTKEKGKAMNKRELYKQKASAQLDEWSASLDVLKARAEKLTAQAKIDMQPRLDAVHEKFAAAKRVLIRNFRYFRAHLEASSSVEASKKPLREEYRQCSIRGSARILC